MWTRSSRTFSGRFPESVVFYASAPDFAAEDPRRATRAYDRASEAENRTILGGSDWGYKWRLEPDPRRSHHSQWRLSWLSTGEFYACCLNPDVRTSRTDGLKKEPLWLIASLAPSGESLSEPSSADWQYELERHQDERNSLLFAVDTIHSKCRPAAAA